MINISENTLRHFYEKHKDLVKILNISNMKELKEIILDILQTSLRKSTPYGLT